jgi:hypothetical protein
MRAISDIGHWAHHNLLCDLSAFLFMLQRMLILLYVLNNVNLTTILMLQIYLFSHPESKVKAHASQKKVAKTVRMVL